MQTTIKTYSKLTFNYAKPEADQIDIRDIAHALSLLCRFAGQSPILYSVAEHSVYVAELIAHDEPEDYDLQLAGLLHDGCEAYINDIPTPLKQFIPQYVEIEKSLTNLIYSKFKVAYTYQAVKHYDTMALYGEFLRIMNAPEHALETPAFLPAPAASPEVAEARFLALFQELLLKVRVL